MNPQLIMAYYDRALTYSVLDSEAEARSDAERATEQGFQRELLEHALEEISKKH